MAREVEAIGHGWTEIQWSTVAKEIKMACWKVELDPSVRIVEASVLT